MNLFGKENAPWANESTGHTLWWKIGAFLFALASCVALYFSFKYITRPALASGPSSNRVLNYQIRLTDPNGTPTADGTKNIKISFYSAPIGGIRLATDCGTTVTPVARKIVFSGGVGTVLIGDTAADGTHNCSDASAPNAISASLFANPALYLGITVEADAEMTPRKRVVATGYSLNADLLDDLDTSAVGGTVAFVPVTDPSGNLTLTKNLTVDGTTLFVDSINDRIGIGTASPVAQLHVSSGGNQRFLVSDSGTVVVGDMQVPIPQSYAESSITFAPATLTGGATSLSLSDDDVSAQIPLPFAFNFFGGAVTDIRVSSNGFVTFLNSNDSGCCNGQTLPDPASPNGLIAGYWNDLYPPGNGTVKYETQGVAGSRKLIVEFKDIPACCGPTPAVTFQIFLREGSDIVEIHTTSSDIPGATVTQGLENSDGTVAVTPPGRNAASFSLTNDAVRFTPTPPGLQLINLGTGALAVQNQTFFNGNVGIATTSPGSELDLRGAFSVRGIAAPPTSPSSQGRLYFDSTANKFKVSEDGSGYTDLVATVTASGWTDDGSVVRLTSASDTVGIGTTSPASQLDVAGRVPTGFNFFPGVPRTEAQAIQGNLLYLGTEQNSGGIASRVRIIDIANPTGLVEVGSIDNGLGILGIAVKGRYAYVHASTVTFNFQSEKFFIYDVSDPSAPVQMSSIAVGSSDSLGALGARSMVSDGKYAYFIETNDRQLNVVDVSDPSAPVVVNNSIFAACGSLFLKDKYLYFVCGDTLQVIDVSDPTSPGVVGSVTTSGSMKSVYVQGHYAYVANSGNNTIEVFNVVSPTAPILNAASAVGTAPSDVYVQGHRAYVTNKGSSTVQLVDVSSPGSAAPLGTVSTSFLQPTVIGVQGRFAFVGTDGQFLTMDLGGTYLQQVKAGGIETSTLAVHDTLFAGDADLRGGLSIGQALSVSGRAAFSGKSVFKRSASFMDKVGIGTLTPSEVLDIKGTFASVGGAKLMPLATPAVPTVNNGGCFPCATTWGYKITAVSGVGETLPSAQGQTTTGNATLSVANNISISWAPIPGATSYKIYRTVAGGTPSSTGLIGTTVQTAFVDNGIAATTAPPTVETSGNIGVGTATPSLFRLQVNGDVGPNADVTFDLGSNARRWRDLYTGPGIVHVGTSTSDEGTISYDTSTNVLKLDSTGTIDLGGGSGSTGCTINASGDLVCTGTVTGGGGAAFINGGNAFGAAGNLGTNDGFVLNFRTSGSTKMTIDTGGNVGIGVAAPGVTLDVQGVNGPPNTALPNGGAMIRNLGASFGLNIGTDSGGPDGNYGWLQTRHLANATYYGLALQPQGGKVSFNTTPDTDPTTLFKIQSASHLNVKLNSTNVNANVGVMLTNSGDGDNSWFMDRDAAGKFFINYYSGLATGADSVVTRTPFTIDTSGNVGIGTTSPITQLNVPGKVPAAAAGSVATTQISPTRVVTQGRYAYVIETGSGTNDSLQIFDISNPSSPVSIGSVGTGSNSDPFGLSVQGNFAYVANTSGNIQVFNVTNPSSPSLVSTTTVAGAQGIYVQGRFAYVVTNSGSNFVVVDISDPTAPTIVGTVSPGGNPTDVFVQGRYAYVTRSSANFLQIIDISNPASPSLAGSVATGNSPNAVVVQGRYAYVALLTGNQFLVIDVSNPASPSITGTLSGLSVPRWFDVQGRYAYVPNQSGSTLQVIDISTPASPTSVGTVATDSLPYDVSVQGRFAYVLTNAGNTLQSFDLGGSYLQQLEAGGIETGSLTVRNNVQAVDAELSGGLTVAQSLNVSGDVGSNANLSFTKNGGTAKFASGTAGNTFIWKIPTRSSGTCSSGTAEGVIFQDDGGTQRGHLCIDSGTPLLKFYANQFNTAATDLAETYSTDPSDGTEAGDVVALDPDGGLKVRKSTSANQATVVGVISDDPGITLSGVDEATGKADTVHGKYVALKGRVPVKVTDENGPISVGDPLASSSTPGTAMKAKEPGTIIGFALDSFDARTSGTIRVFLQNGYWNGDNVQELNAASGVTKISDLTVDVDQDMKGFGIINIGFLNGIGGSWSIDGAGNLAIQDIDVKNLKAEKMTIKNGGVEKTAGSGIIRSGAIGELVINPLVNGRSLIVVTFEGDTGARWWISEKADGKFMLNLSSPALADTKFTYWVVGVEGDEVAPPAPAPEPPPAPPSDLGPPPSESPPETVPPIP